MLFNKETSSSRRFARIIVAGCSVTLITASLLFVQCRQETPKPALTVLKTADKMPVFNGDLNDYLVKSLQYPEDARTAGNEGRSVVQFVVSKDGTVENEAIVRSSGFKSLDDEAMRVVRNMPAWKPGIDKGQPVSVYFTLPITFKLDDEVETSAMSINRFGVPSAAGNFECIGEDQQVIASRMQGKFSYVDEHAKVVTEPITVGFSLK